MIIIGSVCLILGFLLPFLIVLKYLPSTFPLVFLIYGFQLVGMVVGMLGVFSLAARQRDKLKENMMERFLKDERKKE